MPFKSEKQRRWAHANKPEMAKRWENEEEYAMGGFVPSDDMMKRAIRENTGYKDLSRMRAGGMVGNGSLTPPGVKNFKKSLKDDVDIKCKES
tara:strand:+ start:601 stop:876 length:276 start_codon:yes stop_codon:yes gene_type:complete